MNKIPIHESIKILEFGFNNYSKLSKSNRKFNIKRIYYSQQNTIVVEYITDKKDRMDIKIELGEIISFIGSFYLSDTETHQYEIPLFFAATALDKNNSKLIYAVSSHSAAKNIMIGNSIEWLKNSIFEDQTNEMFLTQAKRIISRIETSLRETIFKILFTNYGNRWFESINQKIFNDAYKSYKKNTNNEEKVNSEILSYTYLPQLKIIIESNWDLFNSIFIEKEIFTINMNNLNKIRRDESHNRPIKQTKFNELDTIYKNLMSSIAKVMPDTVPQFLLDNWHISLYKIIDKLNDDIPKIEEKDRYNIKKTINAIEVYKSAIEISVNDIQEILIPANKMDLHKKLERILMELTDILSKMIKYGKDLKVSQLEKEFIKYSNKMNELNDFQKEYLYSEI